MKQLAIVDICGTLFQSNTTFDFIDFVEHDNLRYQIFKTIINFLPIKVLNRLIYWVFKVDLHRKLTIYFLKGKSKITLNILSQKFYEEYLSNKINWGVINRLKELDLNIILASATLEPLAKVISEKMHIQDYFASSLSYDQNEIFKGDLSNDLLGTKLEEIKKHGYHTPFSFVVSNDFTDLPLFTNSENKIIIATKRNYKKWTEIISKHSLCNAELICIS